MLEALGQFVIGIISQFGYFGVFVLMTLESACIPIPSEVTMPFAGSLISSGRFEFWTLGFVGGLANLVGSWIAYIVGAWGQERVVRKFIRKYGKFVLVTEDEFDRSEIWFRKYGEVIVFATRLMPIVRTFISLPAGIAKMNVFKFSIYTFAGSFIWSVLLTYIGVVMGSNWKSIEVYFRRFDFLIVAILVIGGAWYVRHKLKKIKKQGKNS